MRTSSFSVWNMCYRYSWSVLLAWAKRAKGLGFGFVKCCWDSAPAVMEDDHLLDGLLLFDPLVPDWIQIQRYLTDQPGFGLVGKPLEVQTCTRTDISFISELHSLVC